MLSIKRVILYKHGVGFFEREGTVEGNATLDLFFKSDEMNDVLKSLTLLDLSGGIISSISYESTKPPEKVLEDIALHLTDGKSLTDLLEQIKGAVVRITVGSDEFEGVVMGIEKVKKNPEKGGVIHTSYLNLLMNNANIAGFEILEIRNIQLMDESIRTDLAHILQTLISTKKKDSKKLTIYARGEGKRSISASYILETPVWKASYRILLENEKSHIQGWAIIDNTQDEDWNEVSLTLTAGLPISFVHDLYSPRYKVRPVIEVKKETAYGPPELESGMDVDEMVSYSMPESGAMRGMQMSAMPRMARAEAMIKSAPPTTKTAEVGDLFQYEITNPVTVKRNQSALVPILQSPFDGKRVAVFNGEVHPNSPMSAILFKNDTGLTLEGGPVTVIDGETYLGEAMLETMKPGEERIVPYSVELACRILIDSDTGRKNVHRAYSAGGFIYLEYYNIQKTEYKITSKAKTDLDLFLDHRYMKGWKLTETEKPHETTENFHRFRIRVPAGKSITFQVTEQNRQHQSYSIKDISVEQIRNMDENQYIDEMSRDRLNQILKVSLEISDIQNQIGKLKEELKTFSEDQSRYRENLKSLGDSSDERKLKERYVKELTGAEDKIQNHRENIRTLESEKEQLAKNRQEMVSNVVFDRECQ